MQQTTAYLLYYYKIYQQLVEDLSLCTFDFFKQNSQGPEKHIHFGD